MNCSIKLSTDFEKELKRLAKRYKSLKDDVIALGRELKDNPLQGVDLGRGLRKVRMGITSKGKGKRSGARVITLVAIISTEDAEVVLLTLYDKSECENLSDKELTDILKRNGLL